MPSVGAHSNNNLVFTLNICEALPHYNHCHFLPAYNDHLKIPCHGREKSGLLLAEFPSASPCPTMNQNPTRQLKGVIRQATVTSPTAALRLKDLPPPQQWYIKFGPFSLESFNLILKRWKTPSVIYKQNSSKLTYLFHFSKSNCF
jgi:hypothetical protein